MKVRVTPGYGWGWFDEDGSSYDVPPPFHLDVEVMLPGHPFKMAQGRAEGDHPLAGLWIVLIQRHEPADGECNLWAVPEKLKVPSVPTPFPHDRTVVGYATVENSE